MKRIIFLISIFFLLSCAEGVNLSPGEVDGWRIKHRDDIEKVVTIFRDEPCLRRVELGSMEFIDQNCPLTPDLSEKIKQIQSLLIEMHVVLATSFRSEDNFNVSILLNRQGIAVSGSGLALHYWDVLESPWTEMVECGEMGKLSEEHWYYKKLVDGPSCY
jgi:hypothetical protein